MTIDQFYTFMNGFAGVGWLLIIFISPYWKKYDLVVISIVVVILAIFYTTFNVMGIKLHINVFEKFKTLGGVMYLFTKDMFVMAGWSHILCFDLIGGIWMKKNSEKYGINHWALLPTFIFTIMLGPVGFLIYFLTRWIKTGRFFAEN